MCYGSKVAQSARAAARAMAVVLLFASDHSSGQPSVGRLPDTHPVESGPTAISREPRSSPQESPTTSSWATRSALRWFEKAARDELAGNYARALDACAHALRADPTFGPPYLTMARLRERVADLREAERLYNRAVQLPEVAAAALAGRARLRHRMGRDAEAIHDLEAAVALGAEDVEHLALLAHWHVKGRNWAAALAWHRRLEVALHDGGDAARAQRVHLQVQALILLAGDTDPVTTGRDHPSWVRRSLATLAR